MTPPTIYPTDPGDPALFLPLGFGPFGDPPHSRCAVCRARTDVDRMRAGRHARHVWLVCPSCPTGAVTADPTTRPRAGRRNHR